MNDNMRQLTAMFEFGAMGIAMIDAASGQIIRANPQFQSYLDNIDWQQGLKSRSLFLNDLLSQIHPEDRREKDPQLQYLTTRDCVCFSIDLRYKKRQGLWTWFNTAVTATWLPQEAPAEYILVLQNVNERKQLEEKLSSSKELLRKTIDSLREAVFVIDPKTRCIKICNQAAAKIFGYSESDLVGSDTRKLHIDQYHYDRFAHLSEEALSNKTSFSGRFKMRRANGETFPTEHEIRMISLENGWGESVVSVVRDLSERKRHEQELLKLNQALEQSSVAIILASVTGKIEYVNRKYSEITGYSWSEIVGYETSESTVNGALCGLENQIDQFRETKGQWQEVLLCRKRHGDVFMAQVTISPIVDEQGYHSHNLITLIDVTEKYALQKAGEQASRLSAVGTMASGIAHEINNPTTVIQQNLKALLAVWEDVTRFLDQYVRHHKSLPLGGLRYPDHYQEMQQLMTDGLDSCSRIHQIVADLKTFSTPQDSAEDQSGMSEYISLNDVIKTASRLSTHIIKKSTDFFQVRIAPQQPGIQGNFLRLEQVLVNLIINACQALRSRKEALEVITGLDEIRHLSWVEVRDEGEGIPQEYLGKIFEPFFTMRSHAGGSGLGLFICRKIVQEHGGEIIVHSIHGKGTRMRIEFPAATPKAGL